MAADQQRALVLIVDDSRFDRELAREALEGHARIECCASAEEALEIVRREPVDLVLSDLLMPGLSGLELLAEVRREQPHAEFVLLTGRASVDSAVGALRMGAADYLTKPIQPEQLSRVVQRILERQRLMGENERLRETVETIEACRALTPCLDPGEVCAVALDLLLKSLGRSRGIALFHRIALPASDGVVFRGLSEAAARRLRGILVDEKLVDLDAVGEVSVVTRSPLHDALGQVEVEAGPMLAMPVTGKEAEAGVIWILQDDRPFGSGEIERAVLITGHASLSIRNAERYHRAKEKAFIDDVTDIHNVRYLLSAADHEIRRAERYGSPLSFLFLDLDRFKLVNDRFGHLVGSRALRRLSQVMQVCVRQVDTLARYGGDEFTILLVDTDLPMAVEVAERIRKAVEDERFEGGGDEPMRLTVSIGVATYPEHGRSRGELLDTSDKAMYRAKSLGRNRVCTASELET